MQQLVADSAVETGADIDSLMAEVREFMAEDAGLLRAGEREEDPADEWEEEPAAEDMRDGDAWTTAQLAALTR